MGGVTPERQIALQAARAMELALRYLRSGRTESALRVLTYSAEEAREDWGKQDREARIAGAAQVKEERNA